MRAIERLVEEMQRLVNEAQRLAGELQRLTAEVSSIAGEFQRLAGEVPSIAGERISLADEFWLPISEEMVGLGYGCRDRCFFGGFGAEGFEAFTQLIGDRL